LNFGNYNLSIIWTIEYITYNLILKEVIYMLDGDTTVPGTPVIPATDTTTTDAPLPATDTPIAPPAGGTTDAPAPMGDTAPMPAGEEHHEVPAMPGAEAPTAEGGVPEGTPTVPTGLPGTNPADGTNTGGTPA